MLMANAAGRVNARTVVVVCAATSLNLGRHSPSRGTDRHQHPAIGRTIFRIMLGIGAVLLALIMIGVWIIQPEDDDRRRRLCCHE
jgi:hypothetical protein